MATSSAVQPVPLTPARGERHVHFSPEPLPEPTGLRHRYGHQSDLDDPFTGPSDLHGSPWGQLAPTRTRTRQNPHP